MELKIADLIRDAQFLDKSEKLARELKDRPELVDLLMSRWIGKKEDLIAAQ